MWQIGQILQQANYEILEGFCSHITSSILLTRGVSSKETKPDIRDVSFSDMIYAKKSTRNSKQWSCWKKNTWSSALQKNIDEKNVNLYVETFNNTF